VDDLGEAWEKTVLLLRASYFGSIEVVASSYGCGYGYRYDEIMETNTIVGNYYTCQQCEPSDTLPPLLSFITPTKPAAVIIQGTQEENESHDDENYDPSKPHPTSTTSAASTTTNEHQQQQQQPFLLIHAAAKVDCPRPVVKVACQGRLSTPSRQNRLRNSTLNNSTKPTTTAIHPSP